MGCSLALSLQAIRAPPWRSFHHGRSCLSLHPSFGRTPLSKFLGAVSGHDRSPTAARAAPGPVSLFSSVAAGPVPPLGPGYETQAGRIVALLQVLRLAPPRPPVGGTWHRCSTWQFLLLGKAEPAEDPQLVSAKVKAKTTLIDILIKLEHTRDRVAMHTTRDMNGAAFGTKHTTRLRDSSSAKVAVDI